MQITLLGNREWTKNSKRKLSKDTFSLITEYYSHLEREMYSSMSSFKSGTPTQSTKGKNLL